MVKYELKSRAVIGTGAGIGDGSCEASTPQAVG
jgi:hypothetical protein